MNMTLYSHSIGYVRVDFRHMSGYY